jgi:hypothetical protein
MVAFDPHTSQTACLKLALFRAENKRELQTELQTGCAVYRELILALIFRSSRNF